MANRKAPVTQAEITRYLKALRESGVPDARVVIERPDGTKVSIIAGKGGETVTPADDIDAMIERVPTP